MQLVAIHRRLVVGRVEVAVLQILVRRAVELISAALHHLVELAARRVAEFRRDLVLLHGEFGDRVIGHRHQRTRHAAAVVIDSFDREIVVARTLSAHRRACPQAHRAAGCDARVQQRKVDHAASAGSAREVRYARRSKRSLNARRGGVDRGRRGRYFHDLYVGADVQLDVRVRVLVQSHRHPAKLRFRETRCRHRNHIRPRRQVRDMILAGSRACRAAFHARGVVFHDHRRIRHNRAASIVNSARKIPADRLSEAGEAGSQGDQNHPE